MLFDFDLFLLAEAPVTFYFDLLTDDPCLFFELLFSLFVWIVLFASDFLGLSFHFPARSPPRSAPTLRTAKSLDPRDFVEHLPFDQRARENAEELGRLS